MDSYKVLRSRDEWNNYVAALNKLNPGGGTVPYPFEHEGYPADFPCLVITVTVDDLSTTSINYQHKFLYKDQLRTLFEKEIIELNKLRAIIANSGE